MRINNVPVICAECDYVRIDGKYLFCMKKDRTVYNAKPMWCPLPPVFEGEGEQE